MYSKPSTEEDLTGIVLSASKISEDSNDELLESRNLI